MDKKELRTIRASGVIKESIVDGPGIRLALFAQGCPHACPGCHNPETHDPAGGWDCDPEAILNAIDQNPLIQGITFSGGEPFMQAAALIPLAKAVRGRGKDVVCYTGYTVEELFERVDPYETELLRNVDILIDGPFVYSERDLNLRFRGSANQRVLDMPQTLEHGRAVWAAGFEEPAMV